MRTRIQGQSPTGAGPSFERAYQVLGPPCRAYTLLEIILVLALIGLAAAIFVPSVQAVLAGYHIERAGEQFRAELARVRLRALEHGVPYAIAYEPGADAYTVWAIEPLVSPTGLGSSGTGATLASGAVASGQDLYDRHRFVLNNRRDDQEFVFMASDPLETLTALGLNQTLAEGLTGSATPEAVAASKMLSAGRMGLVSASERSLAALQIPGLDLGQAATPIVFEPDGTADRDALIRIADRRKQYVEIRVQALTGSITVSEAKDAAKLTAAAAQASPPTQPAKKPTGFVRPSYSRELTGPGGH